MFTQNERLSFQLSSNCNLVITLGWSGLYLWQCLFLKLNWPWSCHDDNLKHVKWQLWQPKSHHRVVPWTVSVLTTQLVSTLGSQSSHGDNFLVVEPDNMDHFATDNHKVVTTDYSIDNCSTTLCFVRNCYSSIWLIQLSWWIFSFSICVKDVLHRYWSLSIYV